MSVDNSARYKPKNERKRIILDCDIGTDDAVALYLLLCARENRDVEIEMIICTQGNASLNNVTRNCVRLLETAQQTNIPIFQGSFKALLPTCEPEEYYHGFDGFGDLPHSSEPDMSIVQSKPALIAERDLIRENPNRISMICIGPLTNLAILMRYYDDIKYKIKDIYIMGGNHLGIGNRNQSAEFNFYTDPEAARIVLACVKCPLYILPWETCISTNIPMTWRMENLISRAGETWKLINRADKAIFKDLTINWVPCDAFLIAIYLYPEMIEKEVKQHIDVELTGILTRGQVVVDHSKRKLPNVTIIEKINEEFFKSHIRNVYTKL